MGKILDNFYEEISSNFSDENRSSFHVQIKLNPGHPVYKGHFEQVPIAPGVCMVQMLKEILMQKFRLDLILSAADNIKFLVLINPREYSDFNISFAVHNHDEMLEVSATVSREAVTCLKFKGKFMAAATHFNM